jgi:hypothetical protein
LLDAVDAFLEAKASCDTQECDCPEGAYCGSCYDTVRSLRWTVDLAQSLLESSIYLGDWPARARRQARYCRAEGDEVLAELHEAEAAGDQCRVAECMTRLAARHAE